MRWITKHILLFYKLIARIQFILTSTNQHGVHSPFVFDFVTKGLYQKSLKSVPINNFTASLKLPKKEEKILAKIFNYFNIASVTPNPKELENSLGNSYKILYVNDIEHFELIKTFSYSSKNIVIIHKIHTQKSNLLKWKDLCKNTNATVTIDLFYFGLIFFRETQAKEHFKIRV